MAQAPQKPDLSWHETRLKQYAALAGAFRPGDALGAATEGSDALDTGAQVKLLSALAPVCTIDRQEKIDLWTMRIGPRHKVLADSLDGLDALPEVAGDPVAADIPKALLGEGAYDSGTILNRVEQGAYPPELVDHHIRVLDRAGPAAPGYEQLDALNGQRNRQDRSHQTKAALASGFVGRETELEAIRQWCLDAGKTESRLQTLHISGLPGIGKSFLLERCLQMLRAAEPRLILVRLDFDRSVLRVDRPGALFSEITRQVGDERPLAAKRLHAARLRQVEAERDMPSLATEAPRDLLGALEEELKDPSATVVFVLDTLEALRAQGDTHIRRLFEHLDLLNGLIAPTIRLISAGRAEALALETKRIGVSVDLTGLEEPAACELLKQREVPEALWPRILPVARGIPLRLVLAGKAALLGAFDADDLPPEGPDAAIEGYLYRAVLSRVPRDIRQIANEGLIVHLMNADVLQEVVGPALGLPINWARAQEILFDLQRQHWLVKSTGPGDGDWIMHRDDIRATVLNLVYRDSPKTTAEIDRRAAEWFADKVPETALYHRLQMMRAGADLPRIPARLARRFSDPMLADLLPDAADAVRQARGQRSDYARDELTGSAPSDRTLGEDRIAKQSEPPSDPIEQPDASPATRKPDVKFLSFDPKLKRLRVLKGQPVAYTPDSRLQRDLEIMLDSGDLREADYMFERGLKGTVPLAEPLAQLAMVFAWRTGDWALARSIFNALDPDPLEQISSSTNPNVALTYLEIFAEFRFSTLVREFRSRDLRDRVVDLLHSTEDVGLPGGALGFALIGASDPVEWDSKAPDYMTNALAAAAPYMIDMDEQWSWRAWETAQRQRGAVSMRDDDDVKKHQISGMWLAPLNPYSAPILQIVRDAADNRRDQDARNVGDAPVLLAYLEGLRTELPRLIALYLPEVDVTDLPRIRGAEGQVSDMRFLMDLGLTAHWTGAFRVCHRMRNLPRLARAAERWRRTVNGHWAYGAPPSDWGILDEGDREVRTLAAHLSDVERAIEALTLWARASGNRVDETVLKRITDYLIRKHTNIRSADSTDSVAYANALIKADVPIALAVPWAVITSGGAQEAEYVNGFVQHLRLSFATERTPDDS